MAQPTTPTTSMLLNAPPKSDQIRITSGEHQAYGSTPNTPKAKAWDFWNTFNNRGSDWINAIAADKTRTWNSETGYDLNWLERMSGVTDNSVYQRRHGQNYQAHKNDPNGVIARADDLNMVEGRDYNRDTNITRLAKKVTKAEEYNAAVAGAKQHKIPLTESDGSLKTTIKLTNEVLDAATKVEKARDEIGPEAARERESHERLITSSRLGDKIAVDTFNFQVSKAKEAVIEAARERNAQRDLQRLQNTANIEQVQLQNEANRERWQAELDWHKQSESENRIQSILAGLFALGGAVAI